MSKSAGPQHKTGTRMSTEGRTPKLLKRSPKANAARQPMETVDSAAARCKRGTSALRGPPTHPAPIHCTAPLHSTLHTTHVVTQQPTASHSTLRDAFIPSPSPIRAVPRITAKRRIQSAQRRHSLAAHWPALRGSRGQMASKRSGIDRDGTEFTPKGTSAAGGTCWRARFW